MEILNLDTKRLMHLYTSVVINVLIAGELLFV